VGTGDEGPAGLDPPGVGDADDNDDVGGVGDVRAVTVVGDGEAVRIPAVPPIVIPIAAASATRTTIRGRRLTGPMMPRGRRTPRPGGRTGR
jgi:hypothetical protein